MEMGHSFQLAETNPGLYLLARGRKGVGCRLREWLAAQWSGAAIEEREAIGIDIWAPASGGGNAELLWKNARLEGVADRIEFREADARKMPFEDETFDVVVSSGAVHHITHHHTDFEQVMHEMVRVLRPGGQIVIWDVAHIVNACASRLRSAGVQCEVEEVDRFLSYDMGIVFGKKAG